MRTIALLIVLAAAAGSAWLSTLTDNGLGLVWTHVAVRNWEQYGFFNLHGKMVVNVGGFEADTNPEIYPGPRPAGLYPAYLCHHLFTSIGLGGLGFVAYNAVTAAIVLLSIWWLLGLTEWAFWLAAIAVVAPGFVRWQTTLDPILAPVLFGFSFCGAVVSLLQRPSLNWRRVVALAVLILVFSALNWTTVFVHGMLFVTLLALPRVPRRHLILYAGLTAAMAGWVLVVSVASKMTGGGGSSAGFASMYQGYGWGNVGYGQELTTRTALLRLLAVNVLGLFPVLMYLGWEWWRRRDRLSEAGLLYLLPLVVVVVEISVMRNYFGHHPWLSVDFVLLAIVLAVFAWEGRAGRVPIAGKTTLPGGLAWLAAVFAYCSLVLFAAAHNGQGLAFATFVREHTVRDTTIVIRRDTDPALADIAPRLAALVDRHVVVVRDSGESALARMPAKPVVVLTAAEPARGEILARTSLEDRAPPVVGSLLGWYSKYIAHRRAGDNLEIPGQTFFLCQLADFGQ